ncbi:hypothetical protein BDW75DRAFT_213569 [Aspergillus navahoensis]
MPEDVDAMTGANSHHQVLTRALNHGYYSNVPCLAIFRVRIIKSFTPVVCLRPLISLFASKRPNTLLPILDRIIMVNIRRSLWSSLHAIFSDRRVTSANRDTSLRLSTAANSQRLNGAGEYPPWAGEVYRVETAMWLVSKRYASALYRSVVDCPIYSLMPYTLHFVPTVQIEFYPL